MACGGRLQRDADGLGELEEIEVALETAAQNIICNAICFGSSPTRRHHRRGHFHRRRLERDVVSHQRVRRTP